MEPPKRSDESFADFTQFPDTNVRKFRFHVAHRLTVSFLLRNPANM